MNAKLRFAEKKDAGALLQIYKPYVLNTAITFEYEVPSEEEFLSRIEKINKKFPYLICEIDGVIVGYAYYNFFKERAAYQWDIETSVYINEAFHGNKIASAFYLALMELAKMQGFINVYAIITVPNDKSIGFHSAMGFESVAMLKQTGYKLGAWRNVMWMEKTIADKPTNPKPTVSLLDLDIDKVTSVLNNAEKLIN